jgi:hypothetical protein
MNIVADHRCRHDDLRSKAMNSSKWIGGFFSMVFAIGLVVGTQAHADFVTHKSTLTLDLGATTKGVIDYYIYHGNTLDSACL